MKIKKGYIALIIIACIVAVIAAAITATVFILRGEREREQKSRVEQVLSELSSYAPKAEEGNIDIDLGVYAASDKTVFSTDAKEAYENIEGGDEALEINLSLSVEDQNPRMRLHLWEQTCSVGSVYLYNGKIYVCPYFDDFLIERERITEIYDAEELLGDIDWFQHEGEDWQNIQTELYIEDLLAKLGLEDSVELDMFADIPQDPEKIFTDARKDKIAGQACYVFNIAVDSCDGYFKEFEAEIGRQYEAFFDQRSACMYFVPQEETLRLTFVFCERVEFSGYRQSVVTAFDINISFNAETPYISDSILVLEGYEESVLVSNIDRTNSQLRLVEGGASADGALKGYYNPITDSSFYCKYRYIGNDMLAIADVNKLEIFSPDGSRVRSFEFRYNIVDVFSNGDYITVLLGEPLVYYECRYLFDQGFISNGYNYRCVTYELSGFTRVSEVISDINYEKEINVACLCGNTFVFGGNDGWCYFIDIMSGSYRRIDDFYTLSDDWYYDSVENKVWLEDWYIGFVIVDLEDYTYTLTSDMPEEERYSGEQVEAEGYSYINCVALWRGYKVGFARADDGSYLVIYDDEAGAVVASVKVNYTNLYRYLVVEEDSFIWWNDDIIYVADLSSLLGQI